MAASNPRSARLQELIKRQGRVLAILHTPTAAHARIMQEAGCEAAFVGTSGVVGTYTGLADVGTATMTECVHVARKCDVRLEKVAGTVDLEWLALTEDEKVASGSPSLVAKHAMLLAVGFYPPILVRLSKAVFRRLLLGDPTVVARPATRTGTSARPPL